MIGSYVYFIKPKGRKGPIKIGCSNCPTNRLEALGAWSPWPLEVIGFFPGKLADEQFLHRCFAADHTHREWFKYSERLGEVIRRVLAAQSLDCIRGDFAPVGDIRKKTIRAKRSDGERLRFSYSSRIRHCQERMRKSHDRWFQPDDVTKIMRDWERIVPANMRPIIAPTLIARLDEYLGDPVAHSVIPPWQRRRKDPICIPHIAESA